MNLTILHGDIIDTKNPEELRVRQGHYLIAKDGIISKICSILPEEYTSCHVEECGRGIIIPAFSDLHIHMSQYAQRGIGMDKLLSDWLKKTTFPQEAKFADSEYTQAIYDKATADLIRHGTFHAAMFTTIHKEACDYLFLRCKLLGLQAFIGKVNMDRDCPDYLCEKTETSLEKTEAFVYEHTGDKRVKPILTPRFAPTSTVGLMKGLGKIAERYNTGIQTHLVESLWEAETSKKCFPDCRCDTEIYERYGLLGHGPAIFAHVIFPEKDDIEILRKNDALLVHCPEATTNIIAGIMPSERLLHGENLAIALGSDVGSSGSVAVYRQIACAVQLSKQRQFYFPEESGTLTFPEAFYFATAGGGRVFDRVGLLEPGYRLNALVLDNLEEREFPLKAEERLERFCYGGDDRNITARYLEGNLL